MDFLQSLLNGLPGSVGQGKDILVDGLPGLVAEALRLGIVRVKDLSLPHHGTGLKAGNSVLLGQLLV